MFGQIQMESVIFLCFFRSRLMKMPLCIIYFLTWQYTHIKEASTVSADFCVCLILAVQNVSVFLPLLLISAGQWVCTIWSCNIQNNICFSIFLWKLKYLSHLVKLLCAFFFSVTFSGLLSTFRQSSNFFFHAAQIEMNKNRNDEHSFCSYAVKMYNGATVRRFYHLSVILR